MNSQGNGKSINELKKDMSITLLSVDKDMPFNLVLICSSQRFKKSHPVFVKFLFKLE
ncbi:MAG: hypothetical protein ACTHKC_01845 [Candidatus Nitrosocosmicus sp.]